MHFDHSPGDFVIGVGIFRVVGMHCPVLLYDQEVRSHFLQDTGGGIREEPVGKSGGEGVEAGKVVFASIHDVAVNLEEGRLGDALDGLLHCVIVSLDIKAFDVGVGTVTHHMGA